MKKPIKIFAEYKAIEDEAMEQFQSAMKLGFVVQGALMPDVHTGYSLPIGAIVATKDVVVPSWIGFDIGCGVCAVPTTFKEDDVRANAKNIFDQIYMDVPVGFKHNAEPAVWNGLDDEYFSDNMADVYRQHCRAQLGTLGGGNHFIEVGVDEQDTVWIIVHSGSRGVGHKTASHYMRLASKLHTGVNKAKEGHYWFETTSDNGCNYIKDMNFCLKFALANRRTIIERAEIAMQKSIYAGSVEWGSLINRNHNHAELKGDLWIHRKGATHAEKGMMGVVPGNMRDGSFIVKGKGNPSALWSSSHGAGRVMGRKQAKETFKLDDFQDAMNGIQARVKSDTIDESPFAYKDIFKVMELQKDMTTILHHVKPIINIKG